MSSCSLSGSSSSVYCREMAAEGTFLNEEIAIQARKNCDATWELKLIEYAEKHSKRIAGRRFSVG